MHSPELTSALELLFSGDESNTELARALGKSQNLPVEEYYQKAWKAIQFINAYDSTDNTFEYFFTYIKEATFCIVGEDWVEMPEGFDIIAPFFVNLDIDDISVLPDWFKLFKNVVSISSTNTAPKVLPDWLFELEHLKNLRIKIPAGSKIPSNLKNLKNLETLYLGFVNKFESIGDLSGLKKLTSLELYCEVDMYDAAGNYVSKREQTICSLADAVLEYPKLTNLSISCNTILHLKKQLAFKLPKLEELTLNSTSKKLRPHLLFKDSLKLKTLRLNFSNEQDIVPELWDWLKTLSKLVTIELTVPAKTAIPENLFQHKHLESVNISGAEYSRYKSAKLIAEAKKHSPSAYFYIY